MKRVALTIALLLAASSASAEWVKIADNSEFELYMEPTRIRIEGNIAKFWTMYSYKTQQHIGDIKYFSTIRLHELNCKNESLRVLSGGMYSEKMAQGETILSVDEAGNWKNIIPGSLGDGYYQMLCLKKNPAR